MPPEREMEAVRTAVALGDRRHVAWVGLPFANLFRFDRWLCVRAGKTGEYGYDLLVPRGEVETVRARLLEKGRRFELGEAGLEALDACALENWFFNVRREGREPVTPV